MVRKQFYIDAEQERLLKQRARELGISEGELIRQAVETVTNSGVQEADSPLSVGSHASPIGESREGGWKQALEYIRKHRMMRVAQTGRSWTRDDIYAERLARYSR